MTVINILYYPSKVVFFIFFACIYILKAPPTYICGIIYNILRHCYYYYGAYNKLTVIIHIFLLHNRNFIIFENLLENSAHDFFLPEEIICFSTIGTIKFHEFDFKVIYPLTKNHK